MASFFRNAFGGSGYDSDEDIYSKSAPAKSAPSKSAPSKSAPSKSAPSKSKQSVPMSKSAQSAPMSKSFQSAPVSKSAQSAPAEETFAKKVFAKPVPPTSNSNANTKTKAKKKKSKAPVLNSSASKNAGEAYGGASEAYGGASEAYGGASQAYGGYGDYGGKDDAVDEDAELEYDLVSAARFQEAYEAAVRNGDPQQWSRSKLMLVGQGAAGKTSTVRSLLGLPPIKEWISTVGCDLKMTKTNDWAEASNGETDFDRMLHKAAAKRMEDGAGAEDAEGAPAAQRASLSRRASRRLSSAVAAVTGSGSGGGAAKAEAQAREEAEAQAALALVAKLDAEAHQEAPLVSPDEVAQRINLDWARELSGEGGKGKKETLTFSIWDYGGQEVFYALHHLFLTKHGLYLLAFDMRQLLADKAETLRYLRFWLNSVKLHAPSAPVLLVGTYMDVVQTPAEHKKIDKILRDELNKGNHKLLVKNYEAKLSFFPLDNMSTCAHRGDGLRKVIEAEAAKQAFTQQQISLRWIKVLDELLEDEAKTHWELEEVQALGARYGVSRLEVSQLLLFFHEIGMLVHLTATEQLRGRVITQPQWLLNKLSRVIADEMHVEAVYYDSELKKRGLGEAFDRLRQEGIASRKLLEYLWADEAAPFMLDLMKNMLLLCDWGFDGKDEYLVTSLLGTSANANSNGTADADKAIAFGDFAGGLACTLDFSAFYLPDGVFQRLVSICAQYSATLPDSVTPKLSATAAHLSFGWNDFLLEQHLDADNIRITFKPDASDVADSVKTLVSMYRDLQDSVMANLKWELRLVCPRDTAVAAEYGQLMKARSAGQPAFRSSAGKKVSVSDFDMFFATNGAGDGDGDGDGSATGTGGAAADVGSWVSDAAPAVSGKRAAGSDGALALPSGKKLQPLRGGAKYHCFISHKQSTGGDVANLLYEKLSAHGLKVWYDEEMEQLNKASMEKGVKASQAFLLYLSKDVFLSDYVKFELSTALALGKKIVIVHESDPARLSYSDFGEYIESCPPKARKLFEQVESLPYQRRFYLAKPFLAELITRICPGA